VGGGRGEKAKAAVVVVVGGVKKAPAKV